MADQPQPVAISAAFPAPPPFYKAFTTQNLQHLEQVLETKGQSSRPYPLPPSIPPPELTSLPPELRTLLPPPIPSNDQYRSFGNIHSNLTPSSSANTPTPTPARLRSLTHDLLLTFLALTHILATDPGAYGPLWDQLHAVFQEVHKVINGYRPHQARETLILMMEEQLETMRGETRSVRESVERARGVMEGLGKQGQDEDRTADGKGAEGDRRKKTEERKTKRIWEVLEREVGNRQPQRYMSYLKLPSGLRVAYDLLYDAAKLMITPVMLGHQTLHLALVQLLLCTLISTASTSTSTPLPSPSLLKHPPSNLIFPSNESSTSPNILPLDPFYLPWPASGPTLGLIKFYDYATPISPLNANEVFSDLAKVYHGEPPDEYCGTLRRTFTSSTVTLVLEPGPDLTWGLLAKLGFAFPLFMSLYEYVEFKFNITTLVGGFYAKGYIITGVW